MSMTDTVADLLSRIRTAHLAKHDRLDVPASKLKTEICRLLTQQGYISGFELVEDEVAKPQIRIVLKYNDDGGPMIRHMQRISKPGRRVYRRADDLRPVLNGLGVGIVSTSQGLLTDKEARQRRVGGEVLFEIW